MDITKVERELTLNCMADPIECELAKRFGDRLLSYEKDTNITGGLLIHLLTLAESGKFK